VVVPSFVFVVASVLGEGHVMVRAVVAVAKMCLGSVVVVVVRSGGMSGFIRVGLVMKAKVVVIRDCIVNARSIK